MNIKKLTTSSIIVDRDTHEDSMTIHFVFFYFSTNFYRFVKLEQFLVFKRFQNDLKIHRRPLGRIRPAGRPLMGRAARYAAGPARPRCARRWPNYDEDLPLLPSRNGEPIG
jgi:hypothetical protein